MTKTELIKQTRFLLDEYGTTWLRDTDANRYSISDALDQAYKDFATKTKCFKVSYTLPATSGTSEYAFSAFGSGAGSRMFEITEVAFNNSKLYPELETQLAGNWRYDAPGTPTCYLNWGTQKLKLYPTPNSTANIYLEGFETPAASGWATSGTPNIPDFYQQALAYDAAIKVIVRNPNPENTAKLPFLKNEYDTIIKNAIDTIEATNIMDVRVGSKLGYSNTGNDLTS